MVEDSAPIRLWWEQMFSTLTSSDLIAILGMIVLPVVAWSIVSVMRQQQQATRDLQEEMVKESEARRAADKEISDTLADVHTKLSKDVAFLKGRFTA